MIEIFSNQIKIKNKQINVTVENSGVQFSVRIAQLSEHSFYVT